MSIVTWLLISIVMAAMLAACGGGSDGSQSPVATESGSTAEAVSGSDQTPTTVKASGTKAPTAITSPSTATTSPATATTPASATETFGTSENPAELSAFAYGWNVGVRGDDDGAAHNDRTIEAVKDSGFNWVRIQLEWRRFEREPNQWDPLPRDREIGQLSAAGINILVSVVKAPDWALDPSGDGFLADYGEFQEFMTFVSDRYKGKVQAWQIWNEPNYAFEMGGHVRPQDYVNLLQAGSAGIRAGDPNALVVFGAPTPTGVIDPALAIDDVEYLKEVYDLGGEELKGWFDIMGAHANATKNAPDLMWPDNPGEGGWTDHPSFYFRRVEQLRQVMIDSGDQQKSIWLTEFGWSTPSTTPGREYSLENSEEDVAAYLTRAFEIATTEWDFVSGMFIWNLNWSTLVADDDQIGAWSALNSDWSPRPAYEAMTAMPKN